MLITKSLLSILKSAVTSKLTTNVYNEVDLLISAYEEYYQDALEEKERTLELAHAELKTALDKLAATSPRHDAWAEQMRKERDEAYAMHGRVLDENTSLRQKLADQEQALRRAAGNPHIEWSDGTYARRVYVSPPVMTEINRLIDLSPPQKVQAIKALREDTNMSLRDCKHAIEAQIDASL